MDTDINVDGLHQKRQFAILNDHPFGSSIDLGTGGFEDVYDLVCGRSGATPSTETSSSSSSSSYRRPRNHTKRNKDHTLLLPEHFKLAIALAMRGPSTFQYKFRPQHIIFDELCMILQTRAFRIYGSADEVVEIDPSNSDDSANYYSPLSSDTSNRPYRDILVREIAFGPDSDPSASREVSLWFDLPESEITQCTPQQAKRYRWRKRPRTKTDSAQSNHHESSPAGTQRSSRFSSTGNAKQAARGFEGRASFVMVRPIDPDAYELATGILRHRLAFLQARRNRNTKDRTIRLEAVLGEKYTILAAHYDALTMHWKKWAWPVTASRGVVTDDTPVPKVDGLYEPTSAGNPVANEEDTDTVDHTDRMSVTIWNSFVSTMEKGNFVVNDAKHRLPVFETLTKKWSGYKDSLEHLDR